jgi:hypothetical protein
MALSNELVKISSDARVTVRRAGPPHAGGTCVVYWMQRAQRGIDNPALDVAVNTANELSKPVVVFLAPVPYYPHANLRHYRFLNDGIPDIAADLAARNIGFVLRRYPDHSLLKFCEQVKPALVVGDENPLRETESWRRKATRKLRVPFWTVDADVVVPSALLLKAHASPGSHSNCRLLKPQATSQKDGSSTVPFRLFQTGMEEVPQHADCSMNLCRRNFGDTERAATSLSRITRAASRPTCILGTSARLP